MVLDVYRRHRGQAAPESEITEKSTLLSATLESMDQGIMVVDAAGLMRMWNSRVVRCCSLPEEFF